MRARTTITAVALAALPLTACASAASAPAVPDTKAAVKVAAVDYLTLYSAGQWDAAWQLLAPQAQKLAPEAVYAGYHRECPPEAAGMAYDVESVVLAGSSGAVFTYTIPILSGFGSATDSMTRTAEGWRVDFDAAADAQYGHGSLEADVKAAKAAGGCASS